MLLGSRASHKVPFGECKGQTGFLHLRARAWRAKHTLMRRFGDPYNFAQTYTARPSVYAVLEDRGQLLLTEQNDRWSGPQLQLPGGGIDPGEGPIDALHRECMEETGWRIAIRRRLTAYRWFVYMPEYDLWADKICHIYLAHPVREVRAPSEPDHRTLWMGARQAANRVYSPGDRALLSALLAHQSAGFIR